MSKKIRSLRYVEADGFYDGVHLVSPDHTQAEISAKFDRDAHQVRHDVVDLAKSLEARISVSESRLPDAESHWRALENETQGRRPEMAMPFMALKTATVAIVVEAKVLAPVMDGFGISDPSWQLITAGGLVIVTSGLLHLSLKRVLGALSRSHSDQTADARTNRAGAVATVAAAGFALVTTATLGWWRAGEMIFSAANQDGGVWTQFLSQNELLTKCCVTLLTLALPLFAATAFEWGFAKLRFAWEWRRAKRTFLALNKNIARDKKALQASNEKRDHQVKVIEQQKKTWLETYLENYQLGQRIGASRGPGWRVALKIGAVTLLIAGACVLADFWLRNVVQGGRVILDTLYTLVTLGAGGLYGYFAVKAWERPTPIQLYHQRSVVWRGPAEVSSRRGAEKAQPVEP